MILMVPFALINGMNLSIRTAIENAYCIPFNKRWNLKNMVGLTVVNTRWAIENHCGVKRILIRNGLTNNLQPVVLKRWEVRNKIGLIDVNVRWETSNRLGVRPLLIRKGIQNVLNEFYMKRWNLKNKCGLVDVNVRWQAENILGVTPILYRFEILNNMTLRVDSRFQIRNDMLVTTPIFKTWRISNNLVSLLGSSVYDDVEFAIYIDNIDVTPAVSENSVSITMSEDNFVNTFEANFADFSLYSQLRPNGSILERVRIVIGDDDYYFLLEERSASVEFVQKGFSISGRSRAAILGEPYGHICNDGVWRVKNDEEFAGGDDGIMAKALIAAVISKFNTGITVEYGSGELGMTDFFIPSKTLSLKDQTQIDTINTIAEAAGCIVRSGLHNTVIIRKKYPDLRAFAGGDFHFDDYENIISSAAQDILGTGANAVLVENGFGDDISGMWVIDEEYHPNGGPAWIGGVVFENAYLRLYTTPITPVADYYVLSTDGSPEYIKTVEEVIEGEYVEFSDQTGATSKPILSIISTEWLGEDGGSIEIVEEGKSDLFADDENVRGAILKISYRTQYDVWCFSNINEIMVKAMAISKNRSL